MHIFHTQQNLPAAPDGVCNFKLFCARAACNNDRTPFIKLETNFIFQTPRLGAIRVHLTHIITLIVIRERAGNS